MDKEAIKRTRMDVLSDYRDEQGMLHFNKANGEQAYFVHCRSCHGSDGQRINAGTPQAPRYLAHLAIADPVEYWRITNFGTPDGSMPAYFHKDIPIMDLIDILGYSQTLPTQEP